jgi:hypothetical protein
VAIEKGYKLWQQKDLLLFGGSCCLMTEGDDSVMLCRIMQA